MSIRITYKGKSYTLEPANKDTGSSVNIDKLQTENDRFRTIARKIILIERMELGSHTHREDCKEHCYVYMLEQVLGVNVDV